MPALTGQPQPGYLPENTNNREKSLASRSRQSSLTGTSQHFASIEMAEQSVEYQKAGYDSTTPPGETSDEEISRDLRELARQYTKQSTHSTIPGNPFNYEPGSILDPYSQNFRAKAWAKAFIRLNEESETFKPRSAGFLFRDLSAYGHGSGTDYQKSVGNSVLQIIGIIASLVGTGPKRIDILKNFDGLVEAGEMLIVLGPPGSGCSTFLKTIAGETHGYKLEKDSYINYQGVSFDQMHSHFRGEAIYTAEQDVHFPILTVGETLYFAARARAPRDTPGGLSKHEYAEHMRDVIMATFGIKHTINSRVGNDFIRGVSGGERKRVSIAEAALSRAPLQCWDNSTRGLDSANAIEFCKTLRVETEVANVAAAIAIYQTPQAAYELFDKATVLYEGHQIYFGRADQAKAYFVSMGFDCPEGQTDPDFLTSMTSPHERVVRSGFENRVPRTSEDFAAAWKSSAEYKSLKQDMEVYDRNHPIGGQDLHDFKLSRRSQQAKHQRVSSPFTLSYGQQIRLCLWRGFVRLRADPTLTIVSISFNFMIALVTGSVFYNLDTTTNSFFSRGALLFFTIVMNAFGSVLEMLILYDQRPIVEKHNRYALYHPSAEAFASMLTDMPYKTINAFTLNIPIYFMTNLRREAGPFFFFVLVSFLSTLVMSKVFRTIASLSRTLHQALAPAAVILLAIIIYIGFVIPTDYMLGWSRWINYINPVAFAFESIMINEFSGRQFPCPPEGFIPTYGAIANQVCNVVGAVAGQGFVDGDVYLDVAYKYSRSHKWRNVGIMVAFIFGLMLAYLVAAELVSAKKSKGEVLVFRRGQKPASLNHKSSGDEETAGGANAKMSDGDSGSGSTAAIQRQTAIFQWHDVCYDINIKSETRRILDHVDGWVKPGTLTALMGVSGAGKTTLLDVLASRVTMGVIGGEMLVDGRQRDSSFQRKTGYVQQQDLHLATSTVREALNFSAILRQPTHLDRQEKLDYVTEVIKLLEMEEYADAVIGVPGEGLNVEQRKRLTIAVELAAKPQLLLFLDEPTSGLDSQTSWSILSLLEKLTKSGQACLCTIHQPSSMLFQRFDRLLLLAAGGKTVYFGEIGESSNILKNYFERNGAPPCPAGVNPAEWMLEVTGAAAGTHSDTDWHQVWRNSPEIQTVHAELETMKRERSQLQSNDNDASSYREFAAKFYTQLYEVQKRVFQQYWRTPTYIWSKMLLVTSSALFIGFSFFNAKNTIQGLKNQMFGIFMLMTLFGQFCEQIMPHFVTQRALYEVRERPSKTYSWQSFIISNLVAEIPWNFVSAFMIYACWYYPVGLWHNAEPTDAVNERGALMFLLILVFLIWTSTFAHMTIAGIDTAETAGNISNTVYILILMFCGVLVSPSALPGFWIFMYRVSPFTYLVEGMLATAVSDASVVCAANEYLRFPPPANQTCSVYLSELMSTSGGYLIDASSTTQCSYCPLDNTNQFLKLVATSPDNSWRNFGFMWAFIVFNCVGAVGIYWLARVPKGMHKGKVEKKGMSGESAGEKAS